MKRTTVLFALLLSLPLAAAEDVRPVIAEGVALYDQGKYDEAIAKYKQALALDPANETAVYELGLTYAAKNDIVSCISLFEPRAGKEGRLQTQILAILGNCYDIGGDAKKAIAAYRRGLRIDDSDPQLLYNLGVTLIAQGQLDEARTLLKKELTLRPDHPSGRYALANTFAMQSFRSAAVLEYLRFLALEPSGERAKDAATRMLGILTQGLEIQEKGNMKITIDPDARKEEGDYGTFEMSMAITGAARELPENAAASEFEKKRQHLSLTLSILAEGPPAGRDYTAKQNVPFFVSLAENNMLDAFSGLAISSLGIDGTEKWMKENEASLSALGEFLRSSR